MAAKTPSSNAGLPRRESVNQSLLMKSTPKSDKSKDHLKESKNQDVEQLESIIGAMFKDFDQKMEKRLQNLDVKWTAVINEMKSDINSVRIDMNKTQTEVSELKQKENEIENSVSFHNDRMEEKAEERSDEIRKYKEALEEMNRKFLWQEKHRQYNLLFYGFPEVENEDLKVTMKEFFKSKLEIKEEIVKQMVLANYHRMPSETAGPKPIIVKFATMPDRDLVMSKAFHPSLRDERKRILSDLPVVMKRERGRLAQAAYTIRQEEGLKTRIIEQGLSVFLEVRKDKTSAWERRTVNKDK